MKSNPIGSIPFARESEHPSNREIEFAQGLTNNLPPCEGISPSTSGRFESPYEETLEMSGRLGGRSILIVEDEKVVADTLGQILTTHGYQIRVAYSAEDALSIMSQWSPDLAILDVMLPKMNGIELAVVLKEHFTACQVLLFSGQPSVEALMQKARNEGHQFEILAKPVHPTVMLNAISTLLLS